MSTTTSAHSTAAEDNAKTERIDTLDVLLAYQTISRRHRQYHRDKPSIKLVRRNYGDGLGCACPAACLAFAAGVCIYFSHIIGTMITPITNYLYARYGEGYIDNFTHGIDNAHQYDDPDIMQSSYPKTLRDSEGFEDGLRVATELKHLFNYRSCRG